MSLYEGVCRCNCRANHIVAVPTKKTILAIDERRKNSNRLSRSSLGFMLDLIWRDPGDMYRNRRGERSTLFEGYGPRMVDRRVRDAPGEHSRGEKAPRNREKRRKVDGDSTFDRTESQSGDRPRANRGNFHIYRLRCHSSRRRNANRIDFRRLGGTLRSPR